MSVDILIPIETASRELLYKVYLCRLLALDGFNCYLGSKSEINYLLGKFKNYIYLDKGYHEGVSEIIYKTIKRSKGIIVSLDEEGAVDYADGSTLRNRYSKIFFKRVDFTFLWGRKPYEVVKDQIDCENKVEITGHPRFELLKSGYHYLYESDANNIKEKYGNFILINTNMGFGNNIKGDDFVVANYGSRFKNIEKIIEFDKEKLKMYCSLMMELSKLDSKTVILRPHPEEDIGYYKKQLKKYENIEVIYDGSVVPWLLAAEQVIHPDCTTAVEAFFLGKTPVSLLPNNYPKNIVTEAPLEISVKFDQIENLLSYLRETKHRDMLEKKKYYEAAEKYFSYSKNTIKTIKDLLIMIKDNLHGEKENTLNFKSVVYLKLRNMYGVYRKKNHALKLMKNKLIGFDENNIKSIINKIGVNSDTENIKVEKVSGSLFVFSK